LRRCGRYGTLMPNGTKRKTSRLWVGLAEVAPQLESRSTFDGAYTNVAAVVASSSELREKVAREVARLGFDLVDVCDVQRFGQAPAQRRRNPRCRAMARRARMTGRAQIGTFHPW
jgi:hypothetical protein